MRAGPRRRGPMNDSRGLAGRGEKTRELSKRISIAARRAHAPPPRMSAACNYCNGMMPFGSPNVYQLLVAVEGGGYDWRSNTNDLSDKCRCFFNNALACKIRYAEYYAFGSSFCLSSPCDKSRCFDAES